MEVIYFPLPHPGLFQHYSGQIAPALTEALEQLLWVRIQSELVDSIVILLEDQLREDLLR